MMSRLIEIRWRKVIVDGVQMKKQLITFMIFFCLVICPLSGMAAMERVEITLQDRRGGSFLVNGDTLYLKKIMRRQYPQLDVTKYQLHKVILRAASKGGRGMVQLRVGPELSTPMAVAGEGAGRAEKSTDFSTGMEIRNPYFKSWGPWQLKCYGKIRVSAIALIIEPRKVKDPERGSY